MSFSPSGDLQDFSLIFHFQQLDWSVWLWHLLVYSLSHLVFSEPLGYVVSCILLFWDNSWTLSSRYFSHPISSLLTQHQSFVLYSPQVPGPCSFFSTLFFFFVLDHLYWLILKPTGAFLSCVKSSDEPIKGILMFLTLWFSLKRVSICRRSRIFGEIP